MNAALMAHLQSGTTHVCSCWSLTRKDGVVLGFTDHDLPLAFDGITFSPQSGLTARALTSSTGLAVNNTEAMGVLSADAITEVDILAGRFDGADVVIWQLCWDDVSARQIRFRGQLGEITRAGGGFQAELQGLTDALNQPQGRSYLKTCNAVLGDRRCRFDVSNPAYTLEYTLNTIIDAQVFTLPDGIDFHVGWFDGGRIDVLSGAAAGLRGAILRDMHDGDRRVVKLWSPIPAEMHPGDRIRLTAGCDKRAETCREKFGNLINFQGFPTIPGDDWLVSVPRSNQANTGGSLGQ